MRLLLFFGSCRSLQPRSLRLRTAPIIPLFPLLKHQHSHSFPLYYSHWLQQIFCWCMIVRNQLARESQLDWLNCDYSGELSSRIASNPEHSTSVQRSIASILIEVIRVRRRWRRGKKIARVYSIERFSENISIDLPHCRRVVRSERARSEMSGERECEKCMRRIEH
jgi:hypothetical protein